MKQVNIETPEDRIDAVFYEAFETNNPIMLDWALIKMKLKRLRLIEEKKK